MQLLTSSLASSSVRLLSLSTCMHARRADSLLIGLHWREVSCTTQFKAYAAAGLHCTGLHVRVCRCKSPTTRPQPHGRLHLRAPLTISDTADARTTTARRATGAGDALKVGRMLAARIELAFMLTAMAGGLQCLRGRQRFSAWSSNRRLINFLWPQQPAAWHPCCRATPLRCGGTITAVLFHYEHSLYLMQQQAWVTPSCSSRPALMQDSLGRMGSGSCIRPRSCQSSQALSQLCQHTP
jgi:hypothetical protein